MSRKSHTHEEFMRKDDCEKSMGNIEKKIDKFDLALFGKDGRNGMAADIKDIKAYMGVVRQVVVPIVIAVASSLITAWALNGFQI